MSARGAGPVLRAVLSVVVAVAVAGGAAAAGVAVSMRESYPAPPPGATDVPRPAVPSDPDGRIEVAVVLGSSGTVAADALAPFEVFARSTRFSVHTVAAQARPATLSGGLHVLPHRTFADVDADTDAAPDVVVVPAVVDPTGAAEAPLRAFVAEHAAGGAVVLGVCSGAKVLAAAGVLDGRRATSFWNALPGLRTAYPGTTWLAGRRYVDDGAVVTTAGVPSGIVGALRLVERLAGAAEADRIGRDLAYPGWSREADPGIEEHVLGPADLPYLLNVAFPWGRPTVGVELTPGVGEIDTAAAFEVYGGTSFAHRAVPVGAGPTVVTRHGLVLLATPAREVAGRLDRVVRAARPGPGGPGFDRFLRDLAAEQDVATATTTAVFLEYPVERSTLVGPAWPWRSTAWAVATLLVATAVALAVGRTVRRRVPGSSPHPYTRAA